MTEKCSCGISSANLFKTFSELRAVLKEDKPDLWHVQDLIRDELPRHIRNAEDNCNIDLKESKELLKRAHTDAIDQNWGQVQGQVINADFEAWDKLLECSDKKKPYIKEPFGLPRELAERGKYK